MLLLSLSDKYSTMPNELVTMNMLQAFEEKWRDKVSNLEATTSNLQQRVSTLESENSSLKTANTGRQQGASTLESESCSTLETTTTSNLQQRVSTLESENLTLKTGNTSLQQRVSTLETAKSISEINSTNFRERMTNLEMFATHSLSILVEIVRC